MSSELSINSVASNPAQINPQAKAEQAAAAAQANQGAHQAVAQAKTDTVTVSGAALQMAAKTANATTLKGHALATYLKQQGMSLPQIAQKMALTPDAAAKLLGVTLATTTPQANKPTVATAPQPQQVAASTTATPSTTTATAQSSTPADEATESPDAKAQEAIQGKK